MEQQLYKLTLLLGWCFLNFGAADFFFWKLDGNRTCTQGSIRILRVQLQKFSRSEHGPGSTSGSRNRKLPASEAPCDPFRFSILPAPARATALRVSNSTGRSRPLLNLMWTHSLIRQCVYLASLFSATFVRFTHVVRCGGGLSPHRFSVFRCLSVPQSTHPAVPGRSLVFYLRP